MGRNQSSEQLAAILDFIREGDTLVVTRIDRLARSIADLQDIVRTLKARGAGLRATEQPIDTTTAAGKCFLDMLGVFAEFETNLRRERQLEGIAKAKVAGVYKGRKPSIDVAKIEALKASGLGPTEIARKLKIGVGVSCGGATCRRSIGEFVGIFSPSSSEILRILAGDRGGAIVASPQMRRHRRA